MPELPEVETIARGIEAVVGQEIAAVVLGKHDWVRFPPPSAKAHLVGRRIGAVQRRGKQIRIVLEPEGSIVVRLGMTGQITLSPSGEPAAPHTHLRLRLAGNGHELRFRDARRFGGVWIRRTESDPAPDLPGPDALDVGLAEFRALLARPRQVKALLLDQRVLSGVGNIYADESLFAARIHPKAVAARLAPGRVRDLHRALRRILRRAIADGGSTLRDYLDAGGNPGDFQTRHRVYGREGEPCPRCGATIRRIQAAGRSSHVCGRCQRGPR
ncbi:MAG: bifunctional DNA-formamidopyrimidine glycosylase/DNA-(apurinic or apyrimidinic site) lyase, partial [Candidatus Eiseniibacteriota bacterium]